MPCSQSLFCDAAEWAGLGIWDWGECVCGEGKINQNQNYIHVFPNFWEPAEVFAVIFSFLAMRSVKITGTQNDPSSATFKVGSFCGQITMQTGRCWKQSTSTDGTLRGKP